MDLKINSKILDEIHRHAIKTYPEECCGFFYGKNGENKIVDGILKMKNSKEGDKRKRFEISPEDYFSAEKFVEGNGTTLLGVYHSHPDHPAKPSEHDRKQAVPEQFPGLHRLNRIVKYKLFQPRNL